MQAQSLTDAGLDLFCAGDASVAVPYLHVAHSGSRPSQNVVATLMKTAGEGALEPKRTMRRSSS